MSIRNTKTKNQPRFLTKNEIDSVLDFITLNPHLPKEVAIHNYNITVSSLKSQLEKIKLYPQAISALKKEIEKQYYRTIIQPGEAVGILAAQSIGERQTQSNLNVFHKAGSADKQPVTSKFAEILNATKDPKAPACLIYFRENNDSISELRNTIKDSIVQIPFSSIIKEYKVCVNKEDESWYTPFKIMHDIQEEDLEGYTDCLSLIIDMEILFTYKLTLHKIYEFIRNEYADMICMYAPDNYGRIDMFVDSRSIELKDENVSYITQENAREIYLDDVVYPNLKNVVITGISGIKNMFFIRDNRDSNKWALEVENTREKLPLSILRYKKILSHSAVDMTRTISNNIWDIYHTLGIEAAREFMIREFSAVMDGINLCHVFLLVDKMTFNGTIASISRYTMRAEESGPLGKASFEETLDNFMNAGVYGQDDTTNGVSASIICGKRGKFGTGMCEVSMNLEVLETVEEDDSQPDDSQADSETEDNKE